MANDCPISEAERLAALSHVVSGSRVAPESNSARLLTYIVTEAVEGRSDRLKAVTIGQDVFRRGAGFDPSKDSIVRVEMKRLREILQHHYATAGAEDPVRISIPKGSYVPAFSRAGPAAAVADDPGITTERPRWSATWPVGIVAAAGAAILCLGAFAAWLTLGKHGDPGEGEPRLRVEPAQGTSIAAYGATIEVLSHFRNIELVTAPGDAPTGSPADYVLFLGPAPDGVQARLIQSDTDQVVSSGTFRAADFDATGESPAYAPFQVWLGQVASRNGLIEADYIRRGAYHGDFACSVLTEAYFSDQTDARHGKARDCILARLRQGHDSARLHTDLAVLYREEQSDRRNPMPGDPLERATREAQAAITLDRFDANAYYALMTVLFGSGAIREGIAMGERSLDLNPYDGEAVGGFAARLNYAGEHARALELFDISRLLTPGGVTWRDYGYFLAYLGLDEPEAAAAAGIGLRGLDNELYLAAVAISARIRGEREIAQQAKGRLLELEPDLRNMFERRAYSPDLVSRLVAGLEAIDGTDR